MGNVIRDSIGTNKEHSSLKLSVYSTFISKLDKTMNEIWTISFKIFQFINFPFFVKTSCHIGQESHFPNGENNFLTKRINFQNYKISEGLLGKL